MNDFDKSREYIQSDNNEILPGGIKDTEKLSKLHIYRPRLECAYIFPEKSKVSTASENFKVNPLIADVVTKRLGISDFAISSETFSQVNPELADLLVMDSVKY